MLGVGMAVKPLSILRLRHHPLHRCRIHPVVADKVKCETRFNSGFVWEDRKNGDRVSILLIFGKGLPQLRQLNGYSGQFL